MQAIKHLFLVSGLLLFSGCSGHNNADSTLESIPNASVAGCHLEDYPDEDMYVLPFEVNKTYEVSQGNCGWITHQPKCMAIGIGGSTSNCGDLRYAYDFAIPIGGKIVAARSGVVYQVVEKYSNYSQANGKENYVSIEHEDGSVAAYVHLSPDGVIVELGDEVKQGEVIGIAGNSGYTGNAPHLHFHVLVPPFDKCTSTEYSGCKTIPVSFSNAYQLDKPLVEGNHYKAIGSQE